MKCSIQNTTEYYLSLPLCPGSPRQPEENSSLSTSHTSIMTDSQHPGVPSPSLSSNVHHNGRIGGAVSKSPMTPDQNGSLDPGPESHNPSKVSSRTLTSTSPLRTLRTLRGLVSPAGPSPEGGTARPREQSLSSALSSRMRITTPRSKVTLTCSERHT